MAEKLPLPKRYIPGVGWWVKTEKVVKFRAELKPSEFALWHYCDEFLMDEE